MPRSLKVYIIKSHTIRFRHLFFQKTFTFALLETPAIFARHIQLSEWPLQASVQCGADNNTHDLYPYMVRNENNHPNQLFVITLIISRSRIISWQIPRRLPVIPYHCPATQLWSSVSLNLPSRHAPQNHVLFSRISPDISYHGCSQIISISRALQRSINRVPRK